MDEQEPHTLSKHSRAVIDRGIAKYPPEQKQSAVLTALTEVQHENQGYLTEALMDAVADYLEMPRIAVYEVASFYSMLETEPVGRHSISVCNKPIETSHRMVPPFTLFSCYIFFKVIILI